MQTAESSVPERLIEFGNGIRPRDPRGLSAGDITASRASLTPLPVERGHPPGGHGDPEKAGSGIPPAHLRHFRPVSRRRFLAGTDEPLDIRHAARSGRLAIEKLRDPFEPTAEWPGRTPDPQPE